MDPKAALILICGLISQGEIEEVQYNATELAQWLNQGGFYPDLDAELQKTVIHALLSLAQAQIW